MSWVRGFQRKLYALAKERPERGFGILYDKVCRMDVLEEAWKRVSSNKGSCGVDGQTIDQIKSEIGVEKFLSELQAELLAEKYRPNVIRRTYIPKDDGKERPLGIPTVKDRVAQMAVKIVIEPLFEADFLDISCGYRPKRSNLEAVKRVHRLANLRQWVADIDLSAYFDSIPHEKLMACVRRRVRDPRVLALIRAWLKAGILEAGVVTEPEEGTPQGGVLSPLLSNIYLHEFDRTWDTRDGELVRFADDMVILCWSEARARKALAKAEARFTELGLTLNKEKTKLRHVKEGFDFLGFTFKQGYSQRLKKKVVVKYPRAKSFKKVCRKVKDLLKSIPLGNNLGEVIKEVNPVIRGWANYFKVGNSYEAGLKLANYACNQLRIFWRRRKQRKRTIGYVKWTDSFFYEKGLLYVPKLLRA
jgi:group II intron reverse transcriptase/maturase